MSFLDKLKQNTTIENTKGSRYYASTYDANLDIFTNVGIVETGNFIFVTK